MKQRALLFLLLIALLPAACGDGLAVRDARLAAPPTATAVNPEDLPPPAPESITADPDGFARAFYRAWENGDYVGMYSLLTPQSQALVGQAPFVQRYTEALETARVQRVRAQPLALAQDGATAELSVRVTWETAVVGTIVRDHTVPLAYSHGRWGVVWSEGLILPELADGGRLALEYRIPARANIYDRDGLALAFQGSAVSLGVIPGEIEDEAALLEVLSPILGQEPAAIQALYANARADWYVPIGDITEAAMQSNAPALQPFIGAGLAPPRARPTRLYAQEGIAPHIVGYTGFIPAEALERYLAAGYRGDEMVGLAGLEAWGEDYLRGGRGGILSVVGSSGEYRGVVQEVASQQARSVYSTIQRDFQAAVEQALAEAITTHPLGQAGSIVALDVHSGAVRAMASYPAYSPVIFDAVRTDSQAALAQVFNDPGRPLVNRGAQGAYPPGSIFKIISMGAALNSGLYTPDTVYTSTGAWSRLGQEFIKYDWLAGGHGAVSLRQALVVSCNSCFYDVGYTLDNYDNGLLPAAARAFGLGQATGIVGVAENPGLIPDPDWKLANVGDGWATGDAVNMVIGQGYVQVTPLQIVNVLAAIANGGVLYRPTLVDRIGAGGNAPEEAWPAEENGRLPLSAEEVEVYRQSLRAVTNSPFGTATDRFRGLPVPVAGKTGTAEAPPNPPHAWFAGYAPAAPYVRADGTAVDGPEIAIVVMIEHAGEGSAVAAPIFRRIVELYYGVTPLTPFPW